MEVQSVYPEVIEHPNSDSGLNRIHVSDEVLRSLMKFREFTLWMIFIRGRWEYSAERVFHPRKYPQRNISSAVCFSLNHQRDDPKTFNEAMKSQDVAFWKEAIIDEMDSIMGNNTWVLTDLPPSCRPLGCKWIFKRKLKVDGTVENKIDGSGKGVNICLYVDDMLIFGTDQVQVNLTKEFLSSRFSMKDIGEADVIL
nr:zinc finger, CCHC-type [Tanacetum cinerariifolium]